jgi:hypothetical protein
MLFPQVPHVTSVKAGLELAKSGDLAIQTVSSTRESSSCLEFDSRGGTTNSGQCLMAVKHKVDLATPDYGKWEARWHMRGHGVCTLVRIVASRAACRRVGHGVPTNLVITKEDKCHSQTGKEHGKALGNDMIDINTFGGQEVRRWAGGRGPRQM